MKVCFEMQVKPDRLAEYRRRHAAVWPEMLRAIERSGRHNYSLFARDDGLIIGYFEVDDLDESQRLLAADPATAGWEADMLDFFESPTDDANADTAEAGASGPSATGAPAGRADQGMLRLTEVFDLEGQLAALA
ncbi:L-rhamnose mutarotase [Subtercola endophyticus]|nr:L-rhamnose mutarotase [Subtercola endophyticus]